jgi:hypothetical protein
MRRIVALLALATTITTSAQYRRFLSGTFSYGSTSTVEPYADEFTSTFTFGPLLGFHLKPRHVLGVGLFWSTTSEEWYEEDGLFDEEFIWKEEMFEIAPFYRYMWPVGDKCSIYGQATIGLGAGTETLTTLSGPAEEEVEESYTIGSFRFALAPGILYDFAPRWAVSAEWGILGVNARVITPEDAEEGEETTEGTFGFSLHPSTLSFALNWRF